MTNNADYRTAKDDFNTHVAQHKCKPKMLAPEGEQCELRLALWEHVMRVANNLGKGET